MSVNKVSLLGRVGKQPEIKHCRPDGTETYHLSRWLNDKPHEQYRPMTKEEVSIATLHYLSNFEPPRSHVRLDKLIG